MGEPIVTISGQRVYPRGHAPEVAAQSPQPDQDQRPVILTEMSPSGWASGSNEETFEAGLPFLGALVAVILFTLLVLLLANRRQSPGQPRPNAT